MDEEASRVDARPVSLSLTYIRRGYARASNFEREAVVDERALMRDALRHGMGETTYAHIRAEFGSRQERGDFLRIEGPKHATGRSFSTPETIANERANIAHVMRGQQTQDPMMSEEHAATQASRKSFLNSAQRTVIQEVLTSPDRIHGLQGLAGTGKTTVLSSIREGAEQSGYAVEGFAPTSRAAAQLREAGISATTLQSFLARGSQGQGKDLTRGDPASRHLYLLDESSLASTKQMRAFLDKIQPQDRVLVIGDPPPTNFTLVKSEWFAMMYQQRLQSQWVDHRAKMSSDGDRGTQGKRGRETGSLDWNRSVLHKAIGNPKGMLLGTTERQDVRLYQTRTSTWSNGTIECPAPFFIRAVGCANRQNIDSIRGSLNSGIAGIPIVLPSVTGRYGDESAPIRKMIVKTGRPHMHFVIFDRKIWPKAQVDELIVVLAENVHDAVEHIEVMPLGVVGGVSVNHSIVIHSSKWLWQRLPMQ